jgi:lipoate-protein ligase A
VTARGRWAVEHWHGSAAAFHAREVPEPAQPSVWVHDVDHPALVLGSSQPDAVVSFGAARQAGVAVVRRRSGGGAVLLTPGDVLWVDVVVPAGDPLWHDDIGVATHWLGGAWAAALATCGLPGAQVHQGAMVRSPWSALVCFAGLGPGEVLVRTRKVVGISQRRRRGWARFQCAAYRHWDAAPLLALLADPPALADIEPLAVGAGAAFDGLRDAVVDALTAR